jgi:hypothetical protein
VRSPPRLGGAQASISLRSGLEPEGEGLIVGAGDVICASPPVRGASAIIKLYLNCLVLRRQAVSARSAPGPVKIAAI